MKVRLSQPTANTDGRGVSGKPSRLHGTAGVEARAISFARNWLAYFSKETEFLQALSELDIALQGSETGEAAKRVQSSVAQFVDAFNLIKTNDGFKVALPPLDVPNLEDSSEGKMAVRQDFQASLNVMVGNPEVDASLHEVAIRVLQALI